MKFIGVDLTSAFAFKPRPIDVAVLSDDLVAGFFQVNWPAPEVVTARDCRFLVDAVERNVAKQPGEKLVYAIDGPQGLAAVGPDIRQCEVALGTPGRTPDQLPPAVEGQPFQGYIRSSVDLFAGLAQYLALAGLKGTTPEAADLFEVFPGAEWVVLAGRRLSRKTTHLGRLERMQLFELLGVRLAEGMPEGLPTADQHDALVGAYLAWCIHHRRTTVELVGLPPFVAEGEIREGQILHATGEACINMPRTLVVGKPEDRTEESGDWNNDGQLLLTLTDTGAIHGTEPENAWLVPGHNYVLHTCPPHGEVEIKLTYAAAYPGGRAWTVDPTVPNLLNQLGIHHALPLNRVNRVTLRVVGTEQPS